MIIFNIALSNSETKFYRCQQSLRYNLIRSEIKNIPYGQFVQSAVDILVDQNYYSEFDSSYKQAMSLNNPRCPLGFLSALVCVTEKCNASPFMCQSAQSCKCYHAHQFCKTMKLESFLELFNNYQTNLAPPLQLYIERVQKVYKNIVSKIETEMKIFREFVEQRLYGPEYSKIKFLMGKSDYNKITCSAIGQIISKMTERVYYRDSYQEGKTSLQKFTLNQMKKLDSDIHCLLASIEQLYKDKFATIEKQLAEINIKQSAKRTMKSQSVSMLSSHAKSTSNHNQPMKASIVDKFQDVPLTQSVVLKRSESHNTNYNKNYLGTASSNFYSKTNFASSAKLKASELAETNDTKFWNPENPLKSDLSYPKSINSRIVPNATALNHFIMHKVKEYKLIYRASENSYSIRQFYNKMQNHTYANESATIVENNRGFSCEHPMTVIIVKTQYGRVVGGFTRLKWVRPAKLSHNDRDDQQLDQKQVHSKDENYKEDVKGVSTFFSVDLNEKYQLMDPKYGIYCGNTSIGFGKSDLRVSNSSQKHAKSYIGFPSSYNNNLYLPNKKSSLTLSGSHDSVRFKIPEWEAFEVIFSHKDHCSRKQINHSFSAVQTNSKPITHKK